MIRILTLVLIGLTSFLGCKSKKVSIDFAQKECKDLNLKNASYSLENSHCNQSHGFIKNTIRLKVNHNDKKSCLEFFKINASFLSKNGSEISGVVYKSDYKHTDPEVELTDSYIQITFNYTMPSQQSADDLRTIKIELKLENELKDVSNFFTLTVPLGCIQQGSNGSFQTVQDVYVNSSNVQLAFRDYASIDGDIINVYLNGKLVVSNLTLQDNFQFFNVTVQSGQNSLDVIAVNEGTSSPNTTEIRVNNGSGIKMTPGLSTGQSINIIF